MPALGRARFSLQPCRRMRCLRLPVRARPAFGVSLDLVGGRHGAQREMQVVAHGRRSAHHLRAFRRHPPDTHQIACRAFLFVSRWGNGAKAMHLDPRRLRLAIGLLGVSAAQLARASGVSPTTISLILSGRRRPSRRISVRLVVGLEKAFGENGFRLDTDFFRRGDGDR